MTEHLYLDYTDYSTDESDGKDIDPFEAHLQLNLHFQWLMLYFTYSLD